MKIKLIFLFVVLSIISSGCERSDHEIQQLNQVNANSPELIATTPRGNLYKIIIDRGGPIDRVYYFDNATSSVTVNRTVQSGKVVHTETIMLDGVEYIRKN